MGKVPTTFTEPNKKKKILFGFYCKGSSRKLYNVPIVTNRTIHATMP